MPKVSIIVPVYNADQFLHSCVQSIVNQTFTDIEVILVDDGSTDGSGAICDLFASQYPFIKTIHKQNGGEMAARADGVRNSSSEYLYFVDSDDFIAPDAVESILNYLEPGIELIVSENSDNSVLDTINYAEKLLSFNYWTVWGKLIKRSLYDEYVMNVPRFFKVGGDFITNLRLLKNIKGKIRIVAEHKYFYNVNNPSSVQISHNYDYDYEKSMVLEVSAICQGLDFYEKIEKALFKWKLVYLSGMIGLQYNVNFEDEWIEELKDRAGYFNITMKEKLVIESIDKEYLRFIFVIEKKIKYVLRYIICKIKRVL